MGSPLRFLDLEGCEGYPDSTEIGLAGIQSMVPFLKNSRGLIHLRVGNNPGINSECFRLVVEALDGGPINMLNFDSCSISDISVLGDCFLPNVCSLELSNHSVTSVPSLDKYTNLEDLWFCGKVGTDIGIDGCRSIAILLQKEGCSMQNLNLNHCGIGDNEGGGEILANSLKRNNSLELLNLYSSKMTERGCSAFLKLLNDISSIESTYTSNHTLTRQLMFPYPAINNHAGSALRLNKRHEGDAHAVGRAKVIATQLKSNTRRELCQLQGIDYSFESVFADVEPILLPEVLALVGGNHGQSELYLMLMAAVPDLASIVEGKTTTTLLPRKKKKKQKTKSAS